MSSKKVITPVITLEPVDLKPWPKDPVEIPEQYMERVVDPQNYKMVEYWRGGKQIMNTHAVVNGKKHGDEKWFFQNGIMMAQLHWNDGVKEGTWKYYWADGSLCRLQEWSQDKLVKNEHFKEPETSSKK